MKFSPVVATDVEHDTPIATDEIFGPIVAVLDVPNTMPFSMHSTTPAMDSPQESAPKASHTQLTSRHASKQGS
ncbi:aldehyde dehydrogenase family protein [Spelaeicoccus albus]|uniref:Aldehyde dehydrogenase domain-containing protein n=1 Tax=Spelaeicoccus albus TaxID=1280376 RepID=A0A7Z0D4Q2_9MICO|nr:aldehyde dehydrogenase family protein [Spelaeicoccus albus]NYI68833.1 hypothetical protein [Spelaeicoccus albus]